MARHLVTSALPYINGVKHLGNLVGSLLPADVYARYLRERGHEVLFICATDEHGTPAELAAREAGLPVDEFCRRQHEKQKAVYAGFRLSFDHFGRSSSAANRELTRHFANRMAENGYLSERMVKQVYSPTDECFLPDRYVVGTCPHCGYEAARGDQCENCTRLLDPTELLAPRSAVSGSTDLEIRDSRHLFFEQSKLAPRLREWISTRSRWPVLTTSIALKWLNEGLEDRGVTRDLSWGVPVDREGFEGKVFYVWFDAPIAYIGATREWAEREPDRDWRSWWYRAEDVRYTQFMAKDNVPFHTIFFPGMEMATGEPWKLADYVKGVNWLTYYGGKFSTSRKHGVFTDAALEILPSDYWRYFLTANMPESDDVSFTWELLAAQCNKDLADTLGNLVNRVLTFGAKRFGPAVPAGGVPGEAECELGERVAALSAEYERCLDEMQFRKAAHALRSLWAEANAYLGIKLPWTAVKSDPADAALAVRTAMNLIALFGPLSRPLIPDTAARLDAIFAADAAGNGAAAGTANGAAQTSPRPWPTAEQARTLDLLSPGTPFTVPPVLFRKITPADVAEWRERFGAAEG